MSRNRDKHHQMVPSAKQIEQWEQEWKAAQEALTNMYHVGDFIVQHEPEIGTLIRNMAERVYYMLEAVEAEFSKRVEEAWEKSTRP